MADQIVAALDTIEEINKHYDISNENVEKTRAKYVAAKVCTPVIGRFSSGKSALVNTILGYSRRLLKEDITPETSIPAEIIYTSGEERVEIQENNGAVHTMDVADYRKFTADAKTVKSARLFLNNKFLEKIPDVMIVDMPGFESGFEIHNKAIDNYLPQSLAYIITFPADDMTLKESVGHILHELCLRDMPICVVITKCDKVTEDNYEAMLSTLKIGLKKYIGDMEVAFYRSSSRDGNVLQVEHFLLNIQEKSRELLIKRYTADVMTHLGNIENYLINALDGNHLSESELDEKEARQKKELDKMSEELALEQGNFNAEVVHCATAIKNDLQMALEYAEDGLIETALAGGDIKDDLNSLVRSTVTKSIQQRFLPQIDKYLKKVGKCLNGDKLGEVHILFQYDAKGISDGILSSILLGVATGFLFGPILGALVVIGKSIWEMIRGEKERDEEREKIRNRLHNEVFPQIMTQVGANIEAVLMKQMGLINTSVEAEMKHQRATLEKAIEDTRTQMKLEKASKEKREEMMKADLVKIGEIKNDL